MRYSFTVLLQNIINFIFAVAILGLLLRFILRLFGANTANNFVNFIYTSTNPLLEPFRGIFPVTRIDNGAVFDFNILFAIVIYLLVLYLIHELVAFLSYTGRRYRDL